MKKVIVLSAVLLAALNLTSCGNKEPKVETETEVVTEVTEQPADTLAPVEAASSTEAATVTTTTEVK